MTSNRPVYATVEHKGQTLRLGAQENSGMVHVWVVDGPMLGGWALGRFEGGRLTAGTLRALFTD